MKALKKLGVALNQKATAAVVATTAFIATNSYAGAMKGKDKGRPFGMGEHEIGIPQINRSHDFVESGVCPAPKQVMILCAMQEFSYQPMCNMASKIRPAVILSAILLAFFIVQAAISRA